MRQEVIDVYKKLGIDVFQAIDILRNVSISLHCWEMDDVNGFENSGDLTGGIASTGDYPGKARNFEELKSDLEIALKYIPGKKKINIHASYQTDDIVNRCDITYKNYLKWIEFAQIHNLGLDFNPTVFSSNMLKDNLSLSSPDKDIRDYWIKHIINSIKVSEYFGKALNKKSLCNIWIPDGLKEMPADRLGPRKRLKESLDKIFEYQYDKRFCDVSLESKVFGLGLESYTVGSHEFYMNYCANKDILCLMDMGHFHPTENVSDKISSILLFNNKLGLHVSRPVRWDSDHVIKLNDELQEVTDEVVKCKGLDKTYLALDYFDASINRVSALIIGARNLEKAILRSLLTPWDLLKEYQDKYDHTKVLLMQEELKSLPWGEVWEEYCIKENVMKDFEWNKYIEKYEQDVLLNRK